MNLPSVMRTGVNLRYYLFFSGVDQENEEVGGIQDFLVLPQGFETFPLDLLRGV